MNEKGFKHEYACLTGKAYSDFNRFVGTVRENGNAFTAYDGCFRVHIDGQQFYIVRTYVAWIDMHHKKLIRAEAERTPIVFDRKEYLDGRDQSIVGYFRFRDDAVRAAEILNRCLEQNNRRVLEKFDEDMMRVDYWKSVTEAFRTRHPEYRKKPEEPVVEQLTLFP